MLGATTLIEFIDGVGSPSLLGIDELALWPTRRTAAKIRGLIGSLKEN